MLIPTVLSTLISCVVERALHWPLFSFDVQRKIPALLFVRVYAIWRYNKCILVRCSLLYVVSDIVLFVFFLFTACSRFHIISSELSQHDYCLRFSQPFYYVWFHLMLVIRASGQQATLLRAQLPSSSSKPGH